MDIGGHLAIELVDDLLGRKIDDYRRSLLQGDPAKASDIYAAAMISFRNMDEEAQNAICAFFKAVSVNAASLVLGYVDGSSIIPGLDDELSIFYAGKEISGELQVSFLDKVEESGLMNMTKKW